MNAVSERPRHPQSRACCLGLGSPRGLRAPRNFLKLGLRMRPQGRVFRSANFGQELLRGLPPAPGGDRLGRLSSGRK